MTGDLTVNAGFVMDCNGREMKCGVVVVEGGGSPGTGKLLLDGGSADFYCTSIKLNQYGHLSGTAGTIYCTGAASGTNGMAFNNGENKYRHNDGTVLITNPGTGSVGYGCAVYGGSNSFYNLIFSGSATESDGLYANNLIDNDLTVKGGNASYPLVQMDWDSAGQKTLTIGGDLVLETGIFQAEQDAASSNLTLQAGGGRVYIYSGATLDWKNGTTFDGGASVWLRDGFFHASGGTLEANNWDLVEDTGNPGTFYSYGDEVVTSSDNFKVIIDCHAGSTAYFDILANKSYNTSVSGTATPTFSCDGWNSNLRPPGHSTIIIEGGTGRAIYLEAGNIDPYTTGGHAWNLIVSGVATNKKISGGQNETFFVKNDLTILSGATFSTDGTTSVTAPDYMLDVSGSFVCYGTFSGNRNTYAPDQKFQNIQIGSWDSPRQPGDFYATSGTTYIRYLNSPELPAFSVNPDGGGSRGYFHHNSGTVYMEVRADGWTISSEGAEQTLGPFYNLTLSGNTNARRILKGNGALVVDNNLDIGRGVLAGLATTQDGNSYRIGGDVIVRNNGRFQSYYSNTATPPANWAMNIGVSGNVTLDSGSILALDNNQDSNVHYVKINGGFFNNGGEVLNDA